MALHLRQRTFWVLAVLTVGVLGAVGGAQSAGALEKIPDPKPQPGAYGLAATKTQDPPTQGATITTPSSGASFSTQPITIGGICPSDLLVQIYNNGVMVGSVLCVNGSFSAQISLFAGLNELTVTVFDDLEQAGPTSSAVTVTYSDTTFTAFGQLITLTSSYGRRSTPANTSLEWPLQLSGGTGPYAFSLDWGDGNAAELKSQSLAGLVTINHAYKKAGIYQVNVRVTDVNGVSAFLQVVAVSSGKVDEVAKTAADDTVKIRTIILWIPAVIALLLLIPSYWLGRRSEVITLHNKMMKERDAYEKDIK